MKYKWLRPTQKVDGLLATVNFPDKFRAESGFKTVFFFYFEPKDGQGLRHTSKRQDGQNAGEEDYYVKLHLYTKLLLYIQQMDNTICIQNNAVDQSIHRSCIRIAFYLVCHLRDNFNGSLNINYEM